MQCDLSEELHWVRSQIQAFLWQRNSGIWLSQGELEQYSALCLQERELLDQVHAA